MSSFSMFGTCQGCGLTQYMQGQPCRDCGERVQQGGVRKPSVVGCKSTYCECSDMNRAHCDALLTDRAKRVPYTRQLVQEYNSAPMREQLVAECMNRHTAFLNRAVNDCLARLGLTLAEAVQRLTRHVGPSWEELYLDGERVLRVSWEFMDDSFRMSRSFHGPAELIPIT